MFAFGEEGALGYTWQYNKKISLLASGNFWKSIKVVIGTHSHCLL